jgi:hypothetical protein
MSGMLGNGSFRSIPMKKGKTKSPSTAKSNYHPIAEPSRVGSYGLLFKKEAQRLGNMDALAQELQHKHVQDAIAPDRSPTQHKYAKNAGLLYGTGSDSILSAKSVVNFDYADTHIADEGTTGVRRSALQLILDGQCTGAAIDADHARMAVEGWVNNPNGKVHLKSRGVGTGTASASASGGISRNMSEEHEYHHHHTSSNQGNDFNRSKSANSICGVKSKGNKGKGTGVTNSHLNSYQRYGDVSPVRIVKGPKTTSSSYKADNGNWNVKGKQPIGVTETLQNSERLPGGKYYITPAMKKDDYADPMKGEPLGEIGSYPHPTSNPRFWPEHVGFTKNAKTRPHPQVNPRHQAAQLGKACSKSQYRQSQTLAVSQGGHGYADGGGSFSPQGSIASSIGFGSFDDGSVIGGGGGCDINAGLFGGGSWVSEDGNTVGYANGANPNPNPYGLTSALRHGGGDSVGEGENTVHSNRDAASHVRFDDDIYKGTTTSRDEAFIQSETNKKNIKTSTTAIAIAIANNEHAYASNTVHDDLLKDILVDDISFFKYPADKFSHISSREEKLALAHSHPNSHPNEQAYSPNGSVEDSVLTGIGADGLPMSPSRFRPPLPKNSPFRDSSNDHPVGFSVTQSQILDIDTNQNNTITDDDLMCGKLAHAEKNGKTRVLIAKNTKKGLITALHQMHDHGSFMSAKASSIATHNKYGMNGETNSVNGSYENGSGAAAGIRNAIYAMDRDSQTLASNTLQLSEHNEMLTGLPVDGIHIGEERRRYEHDVNAKEKQNEKKAKVDAAKNGVRWSSLAGKGGKGHRPFGPQDDIEETNNSNINTVTDASNDMIQNKVGGISPEEQANIDAANAKPKLIPVPLPHDHRYDKNGYLITDKKLSVKKLTGTSVDGTYFGSNSPGAKLKGSMDSNVTFYNPEKNQYYGDALADHIQVLTDKGAGNPFRESNKLAMKTSFNKLKPVNPRNPTEYRSELSYKKAGSLSIVIKADKTTGGRIVDKDGKYKIDPQTNTIALNNVPTRSEIQKSLSFVARKTLLGYDTRIVETGALLKALTSPKHSTPGIPAIMDLHHALIGAGALNPNQWLLKREQVAKVIRRKAPWLEENGKHNDYEYDSGDDAPPGDSHGDKGNQGVLRRLISAYDADKSGLVKFVRLSVSLLCCCKPDMANLISLLSTMEEKLQKARQKELDWDAIQHEKKNYEKTDKLKTTSTSTHGHIHDAGDFGNGTGAYGVEDVDCDNFSHSSTSSILSAAAHFKNKYGGEVYLLKLIHGLYEDCEGTFSPEELATRGSHTRSLAEPGMGIRIDDISEALCCCSCSIEDELVMGKLVDTYLIQRLYDKGQYEDKVLNDPNRDTGNFGEGMGEDGEGDYNDDGTIDSTQSSEYGQSSQGDLSSNFTALSRFTPASGSVVSLYQHGGVRSQPLYQPRWPEHSKGYMGKAGSMVTSSNNINNSIMKSDGSKNRAPNDRHSGVGIYSASAKAVEKFMTSSRDDTFDDQKMFTNTAHAHAHSHGGGRDGRSQVRGGDSLAWDDDSLNTGGPHYGTTSKNHGHGHGTGTNYSQTRNENKYDENGKLKATSVLKQKRLRTVRNIPRVSQDDFIALILGQPPVIEEFLRQLKHWRGITTEYIKNGSVTFEKSMISDASYGTRNNNSVFL